MRAVLPAAAMAGLLAGCAAPYYPPSYYEPPPYYRPSPYDGAPPGYSRSGPLPAPVPYEAAPYGAAPPAPYTPEPMPELRQEPLPGPVLEPVPESSDGKPIPLLLPPDTAPAPQSAAPAPPPSAPPLAERPGPGQQQGAGNVPLEGFRPMRGQTRPAP